MRVAIYPGSFDPITYGHLNIIERGARLFDKLVIAVAHNVKKQSLFTVEERLDMIRETTQDFPNVEIDAFSGLLIDYANSKNACAVLRGLRSLSDFDFEFQMALMNHRLNPDIETVFLMTGEEHLFVASQLVRELGSFGGDISGLVPPLVHDRVKEKFK